MQFIDIYINHYSIYAFACCSWNRVGQGVCVYNEVADLGNSGYKGLGEGNELGAAINIIAQKVSWKSV